MSRGRQHEGEKVGGGGTGNVPEVKFETSTSVHIRVVWMLWVGSSSTSRSALNSVSFTNSSCFSFMFCFERMCLNLCMDVIFDILSSKI